jgi:threonine/homoserine/homoserine lactone efflux protein
MTWHAFIGDFASPKMWYLPTAYAAVWVAQAGYLSWIAVRWLRAPRKRA